LRSTSWVFGSIVTDAAGQETVIFAIDAVTVGGARYLIVAAKTASAGAEPLTLPVWSPSFVNQRVSGAATAARCPCKLAHWPSAFEACPGGSRTSARKSSMICEMIPLALVWLT